MPASDDTKNPTTSTPAARAPRERSPRKPAAPKPASTPAAAAAPKSPARSRRRTAPSAPSFTTPAAAAPAAAAPASAAPAKTVRPPRKRTPKAAKASAPVEVDSSVEDLSSRRKAKVGVEGELTRAQAAAALRALADGLENGNIATKGDESRLSLGVPDALTFELNLKKRGRRAQLSFELKWRNEKEEAPKAEPKVAEDKSARAEKKARNAARQA